MSSRFIFERRELRGCGRQQLFLLLLRFSLLFVGISVRLFSVRLGGERYSILIYFGLIVLFLSFLVTVPIGLIVKGIAVFRLVAVLLVPATAAARLREHVACM
jgi:hypothetical protein